jgi:hypothetical protein
MWQNGYSLTPYRRGAIDRTGSMLGRLIRACIPFLPYLFVALLIYTPGRTDTRNSTWNAFVVLLLACLIFWVEKLLALWLKRLGESHPPAIVAFWAFAILVLVLQVWTIQAGTAMLFHRWREGHALSLLAAALFLPVALIRWIRTNVRPAR